MKELIEAVNKLHQIFHDAKLDEAISLPRIVVVGDQSSGKSSILESFVGRRCLPKGDGIVTRCPINLQLINIQEAHEIIINGKLTKLEDYIQFPVLKGEKNQFFDDFEKLPDLIEEEVASLAGPGKDITNREIIVKIYSKAVPTLTVIDLPGIIKNPVAGQAADIEEDSKNLILKYIKEENTIILAVMMATNEIASAESVKLARMHDPYLTRTILVVTKLDLGVDREKLVDTLEGKVRSFELGIVGVINKMEAGMSFEESRQREQQLLMKHFKEIACNHGGQNLIELLQECLLNSIKLQLPEIRKHVEKNLREAGKELKSLGTEITSTEKKHSLVDSVVGDVAKRFRDALVHGREVDADGDCGKKNCRARIAEICNSVAKNLPVFDEKTMSDEVIMQYLENAKPLITNLDLPEEAFQLIAKKVIESYEAPTLDLAYEVRDELVTLLGSCIEAGGTLNLQFPALISTIEAEAQQLLDERMEIVQKSLSSYIALEAGCIKTCRAWFKDKADSIFQKQRQEETESQICTDMRSLVKNYCEKLVAKNLQDHLLRLVQFHVIKDIEKSLCDPLLHKFRSFNEQELGELLKESKKMSSRRATLKKSVAAMEEALNVIKGLTSYSF